jgi:hypothetical protein
MREETREKYWYIKYDKKQKYEIKHIAYSKQEYHR